MTIAAYGRFTEAGISEKCSIPDCDRPVMSHGWCGAHYMRWYRHGDPLAGRTSPGEAAKYLENVVLGYQGKECLIWPFTRDGGGYAQMKDGPQHKQVHRLVCERVNGPAPTPGHEAAHSCGKGHLGCVTGAHLSWKTHRANLEDRLEHGTMTRGSRNGISKLTEAGAREIMRQRGKISQEKLAAMFGVTQTTISRVVTGKCWSWIDKD